MVSRASVVRPDKRPLHSKLPRCISIPPAPDYRLCMGELLFILKCVLIVLDLVGPSVVHL